MTSEEQHYAAKVFLRDYFQAINVVKECAIRKAYRLNYSNMVRDIRMAFDNKEIAVKDGRLVAGQNIRNNRPGQIKAFYNDMYSKYFDKLESTNSATSLQQVLQNGLKKLREATDVSKN